MDEKDSREKLIEAATALFSRKGFAAVSIRELAEAAGTNSAMISYYFGGKEGLYSAVLETNFSVIHNKLAEMRQIPLDPVERLKRYVLTVVAVHTQRRHLLQLLLGELTNPTNCFDPVVKNTILQIAAFLRETFTDGVKQGIFRQDIDPSMAAVALAGMMNFYFLSRPISAEFLSAGEATDRKYADQVFAIFLSGCCVFNER